MRTPHGPLLAGLVIASLAALSAQAQDSEQNNDREQSNEWNGRAKDAWLDGKLEGSYLLNTELNNFNINTEVEDGRVTLTGKVETETHRELAEHIARNLEGVTTVDNQLEVGETNYDLSRTRRNFVTGFYDMTTTTSLKSEYAINSSIRALDIDVDTKQGVVTLSGKVASEAAKQLAEEIAQSYDHVREVRNNLQVTGDDPADSNGPAE